MLRLSLLCNAEKALDCGEDAGGFVGAGSPWRRLWAGETLASFGHDEAQGFDQVRVGVEDSLHRVVADFKHFSFFEGDDIRRSGSPVNRAISPKKSPSFRVATVRGRPFSLIWT